MSTKTTKPPCILDDCEKMSHSRGLCQAHYRRERRREIDPEVGTRTPGPSPVPGATSHRAMRAEEKAARSAARKAAKTHCVHGHELTESNTYVTPRGQKICRLCQRRAQQEYHGRPVTSDGSPIGPRNGDKTHCPSGHDYAVWGRNSGRAAQRFCTICHRHNRVKRVYGLSVEQWDFLVLREQGRCAVCWVAMEEPHIDHDHSSGEVRGLLCTMCNRGIGMFYDDPARLEAAAAYLREKI